jgi:NAD(P)-dependent dehydrogenase (short-subunit alcohol dehydrogenase family)
MDLADRVVLVSGGTQGVGAAIARAAARAGASVAVSGRRPELGAELVADLKSLGPGHAEYWSADLTDVAQAQDTVARTVERFGRIDGLVNSAGLTNRGTLVDTTPELFAEHIAINLRAPFFLMQAAVRDMLARGAPGAIVNIITMSAHGGQPYLAPYVAAKAGLVGLTRNAAHAHRFDRIRINGINIGWTETPGEHAIQRTAHGADDGWVEQAGKSLPMGRLAQADDVAALAVLLLSDGSGVVTGSVIDWDQQVPGAYD